jgi:hypothetical protein
VDSGVLSGSKGAIAALKSDKSWFEGMNLIYRDAEF